MRKSTERNQLFNNNNIALHSLNILFLHIVMKKQYY